MKRDGRGRGRGGALALALLLLLAGGQATGQEREAQEVRRVTLQEALRRALRNNPDLRQARSDVETAEFDRLAAYGSFLPTVSLGYGYLDATTGRIDPTGQSIAATSYTMQLGASVDLFRGGRRIANLKSARLGVRAEEARYRRTEYDVRLAVKSAYYDVLAGRELVRVEEDRVRRQEDQLEFVEEQVELGRATRSDLLRSRIELNDARLALLNARNRARASTFSLAEAMGVAERVEPVPEATLEPDTLPYGREELIRLALDRGPSVVSARAAHEAAESEVASSRSGYLPDLRLRGGWDWRNSEFPPENRSWSFQISGSLPLFDGLRRETSLMRSRARADAAEARKRASELAIRSQVDDAFSQVEAARAAIEIAEGSVELAREDLRISRERYRLGLATILDLQAAQISLEQAEVELVRNRFDYQLGVARLESLVGRRLRP